MHSNLKNVLYRLRPFRSSKIGFRGNNAICGGRTNNQGGLCLYDLALAFSLTCPPMSSTENSTSWQPYCLRISSVFLRTKEVKESRLPETFSPAFFLAATRVL